VGSTAASQKKAAVGHDPTIYPVVDKMGESMLQRLIAELLRPLLASALARQGVKAFVGADQFIYYEQYAPTESVSPDVYVMHGIEPDREVDCWKLWEESRAVPSFAVEIVSWKNPRKDAIQSPVRHAALGTKELVVFDPYHARRRDRDRHRFHVFRRLPKRGLVQVEVTDGDRVYSKSLRLWLRTVGDGMETRLRLAQGPEGDELIPTAEEARDAAEAEVARLRAEVARVQLEAREAVDRTHRQYRRDLVPVRHSPERWVAPPRR
jgi:Putative restriction endonuclease